MLKTLMTAMVVLGTLAAPLAAQDQTIKQLKACGSEAKNAYGFHKEHPAVDEGSGYVGFQTEEANAEGTFERYSLVNCATRKVVRIEAQYLLKESRKAGSFDGDLFSKIKALRKASGLANETLISEWAKGEGFKVTAGDLPKRDDERSARTNCGCSLYYPGL
jgi:hypothetical protein